MSPQMKSLQLWQKVGLVRVTFLKQWPGAGLWYLGRSPGDCCALFFTVWGLAVRLLEASGSAGLFRLESAMSSHTNYLTKGRQHGLRLGLLPMRKNRFLGNTPPPVVRHPTGPDTAAQPGVRAPSSVCLLELSPLHKLIIQTHIHRVGCQLTTLWSKQD